MTTDQLQHKTAMTYKKLPMYPVLLLLTALFLTFTACNRENGTTPQKEYYVNFKLDGRQINITDSVVAVRQSGTMFGVTIHSIVVGGYTWKESVNGWDPALVLNMGIRNRQVQPQTYFAPSYNEDADEQLYISYFENCYPCDTYGANHFLNTFRNVTITYSEISETHTRGTFSGIAILNGSNGGVVENVSVEITEGEFYAPIVVVDDLTL